MFARQLADPTTVFMGTSASSFVAKQRLLHSRLHYAVTSITVLVLLVSSRATAGSFW